MDDGTARGSGKGRQDQPADGGKSGGGTFPTQASGGGPLKGKPDGVAASPSSDPDIGVQGRTSGGDGEGGAYPNPHTGRKPTQGGFMDHGGQTDIGYHGGGQTGQDGTPSANATSRGNGDRIDPGAGRAETGRKPDR